MRKWRYKLSENFSYKSTHFQDVDFDNEWIMIADSTITIRKEYAWDGCSPSFNLPIIGWVGVPDGDLNDDGRPMAFFPTVVHDALCQFREDIYIEKKDTVNVLHELLVLYGFPKWRASLYAFGVNLFGPQKWLGLYFSNP